MMCQGVYFLILILLEKSLSFLDLWFGVDFFSFLKIQPFFLQVFLLLFSLFFWNSKSLLKFSVKRLIFRTQDVLYQSSRLEIVKGGSFLESFDSLQSHGLQPARIPVPHYLLEFTQVHGQGCSGCLSEPRLLCVQH